MQNKIAFESPIGKYHRRYLILFWSGVILFTAVNVIVTTNAVDIRIGQAVQAIGLAVVFYSAIFLCKPKIDSDYLRVLFILYCTWSLIIVVRRNGVPLNYSTIKDFLFGYNNGGLIYFVPLVLLFPRNGSYYKILVKMISISGMVFLVLSAVLIKYLLAQSGQLEEAKGVMETIADLAIPSAFILLTFLYHNNKKVAIAIVTILITILFSLIRARRGLILIASSLSFFSILLYFFYSRRKLIIIYSSILLFSIAAAYSNSLYHVNSNKLLGFLYERGTEDTRSTVEIFFDEDMNTTDWLIGRGINGKYYCPGVEEADDYRTVIETGYLQIILKGGIISLGLLLLILVPAVIQGIFFSKNLLSKAAAIWIIQFLSNLYPRTPVDFTLTYFMVWVCVGICYSRVVRKMSDNEIRNSVYSKNAF